MDLEEEVVLIAGGAGGLGGLIAETYGMRGVSVAVLDVKKPEGEELEGVEFYECDAGNVEEVLRVKKKVMEDVSINSLRLIVGRGAIFLTKILTYRCQLGLPSIIINCAAAPINGESFSQLSSDRFLSTINANFIGAQNILKAFLPEIIESETGGTFVTVSSILAHFSPANLSDYAASKAALSAMHNSLVSELRQAGESNVKGILVETGQIGTSLFGHLETPNKFLAPVVETRQVAKEIMSRIDSGEGGIVRLPLYADWISWYGLLPASLQILVRWLSQIDTIMAKSNIKRSTKPKSPARNLLDSSDDEGVVVEKEG